MAKTSKAIQQEKDHNEYVAENNEKYIGNFKKQNRIDDEIGGKQIILKDYDDNTLNLDGYELSFVYDDVVLVEYVDEGGDTGEINRGGIIIPISNKDKASKPWRIGKVLLAGPQCQYTKVGDLVQFPDDKGLKAGNIDVENYAKTTKRVVFLNESRLFGKVKVKKQ
jgi:co-chaperonin GroES (HSP10)